MNNLRRYEVFALEWYGELKAYALKHKKIGDRDLIDGTNDQIKSHEDVLQRLGLMEDNGHMSIDCGKIVHRAFVKRNIQFSDDDKENSNNV